MPPKKKGRTTTRGRAKPVLNDVTNLSEDDQRKYRQRQVFLKDNFKKTVKQYRDEIVQEQERSLARLLEQYTLLKQQLRPYVDVTMLQLYEKQHEDIPVPSAASPVETPVEAPEETPVAGADDTGAGVPPTPRPPPPETRMSDVSALVAAMQQMQPELPEPAKKRGRKKRKDDMAPPAACLSAARSGGRPAPASANPLRSRKAQATPLGQRTGGSHLLVTPKWDARLPPPPGTARRPQAGEVGLSLRGSPLAYRPAPDHTKELLERFIDSRITDSLTAAKLKSGITSFVKEA